METKEIFESYKKIMPTVEFKVVKGWVYRKNFSEKRFSCYQRQDLFIADFVEMQNQINANENSNVVIEFLKELGLEILNKSIFGSVYFYTKKGTVRVSNHHWTSEKHNEPSLNLCSYEKNGHVSMINQLKQFLN